MLKNRILRFVKQIMGHGFIRYFINLMVPLVHQELISIEGNLVTRFEQGLGTSGYLSVIEPSGKLVRN